MNNILVPESDDELDDRVVSEIAESIKVHGLLQPIAVRRVTEKDEDGDAKRKIVLVFGAHRLEAMKYIGQKLAPVVFVECDERQAQLVRLGENLWRRTFTVLQRADMLVEYLHLASARLYISGQVGRKSKRGRPGGGISLIARQLPAIGRTGEARRKIISRFDENRGDLAGGQGSRKRNSSRQQSARAAQNSQGRRAEGAGAQGRRTGTAFAEAEAGIRQHTRKYKGSSSQSSAAST